MEEVCRSLFYFQLKKVPQFDPNTVPAISVHREQKTNKDEYPVEKTQDKN